MTTFAFLLLWIIVGEATVLATIALGPLGWALPSVGLVLVLIVARRSPPARLRATALVVGLHLGTLLENGLLVLPAVYLALGTLASASRLLFPLRTSPRLLVLGLIFAVLEALLLELLGVPNPLAALATTSWQWASLGLLLTAAAFAGVEALVAVRPKLRHRLERP
jgi:hypothetical protein